MLNKQFGAYFIHARLGAGRIGTVYKAFNQGRGLWVALRIPHDELIDRKEMKDRFLQLAEFNAALDHPHLLTVHDYGEVEGIPFMAMEFLEGVTFADLIRNDAPLQERARIIEQVSSALDYLHTNGYVHYDVKPQNVLMLRPNHAVLCDVGMVYAIQGTKRQAIQGISGTPAYMSPEQARAEPDLDYKSDLYSLGVMAFEAATNRLPFTDQDAWSLLEKHLRRKPPRPTDVNRELHAAFNPLLLSAIAKKPEDRPASAGLFAYEFEKATQLYYDDLEAVKQSPVPLRKENRRRFLAAAILVMGLVALVLFLASVLVGDDTKDEGVSLLVSLQPTATATFTPTFTDTPLPTAIPTQTPPIVPTNTLPPMTDTPVVQPSNTPLPITGNVTVTSNRVNIRTGPGLDYSILRRAERNESFPVVAILDDEPDWFLIEVDEATEQRGWISSEVVQLEVGVSLLDIPLVETIPPTAAPPTRAPNTASGNNQSSGSNPQPSGPALLQSASITVNAGGWVNSGVVVQAGDTLNITVSNAGGTVSGRIIGGGSFTVGGGYQAVIGAGGLLQLSIDQGSAMVRIRVYE